jgi:hypothetical protein
VPGISTRSDEASDRRHGTTSSFWSNKLAALEEILSAPQTPGTLRRLVEWDANWAIDHDQTDHGAGLSCARSRGCSATRSRNGPDIAEVTMTLSDGYLFWVADDLDPAALGAALAGVPSVAVTAVDVSADDEDDRHWERPVLCGVTRMSGDLRLHLDIYVRAGITLPSAEEAAAGLAARLHTLVAHQSVTSRPDAYWLGGRRGTGHVHGTTMMDSTMTTVRYAGLMR